MCVCVPERVVIPVGVLPRARVPEGVIIPGGVLRGWGGVEFLKDKYPRGVLSWGES